MKASLAGFVTIGLCVSALAWLVPNEYVSGPLWFFVFLALAACGQFSWFHPKAPVTPAGWLRHMGGAIILGFVLAGVDGAFFGFRSGHPVVDLSLAVCGAIVAASGFARSIALGLHRAPNPAVEGTRGKRTSSY